MYFCKSAYEETLDGTGAGEVSGTPAAGATTVSISAAGGDASNHYNVGDIVHCWRSRRTTI